MKFSKERAIRVIKRLSIEPTMKSPAIVPQGIVKADINEATESLVGNWIRERRKNRLAEAVFSNRKILGWKSS